MNLDEDKLEEITHFSKLQFTPLQIATIMGFDVVSFEKECLIASNSAIYGAYVKGNLMAIAEIREATLQQAKNGNAKAHKVFTDLIEKRKNLKV